MSRLALIIAAALLLPAGLLAQSARVHQTYSGPFPRPNESNAEGHATYSYYSAPDGTRVYDGPFEYSDGYFNYKGNFSDDRQDGRWFFNRNGVKLTVDFKDGLVDGIVKQVYSGPDSVPNYFYTFKDGYAHGKFKSYTIESGEYRYGRPYGTWTALIYGDDRAPHRIDFDITDPDKTDYKLTYIDNRTGSKKSKYVTIGEDNYYYPMLWDIEGILMRESTGVASEPYQMPRLTEIEIVPDEHVNKEIKSVDDIIRSAEMVVVVDEPVPMPQPSDDNRVYTAVEEMPAYPGGDAALFADVSKNIIYPAAAHEEGVSGRVVVQFVVTKEGEVGEVKVVRSKHPDLDKEAKRVVKTLKKFTPGKMNGKPVNVWYILPITFRINSDR